MNESLEIQGQVRITPGAEIKQEGILIQVERNRIVLTNFYSKAILEEKPPIYVTFIVSEEKKLLDVILNMVWY